MRPANSGLLSSGEERKGKYPTDPKGPRSGSAERSWKWGFPEGEPEVVKGKSQACVCVSVAGVSMALGQAGVKYPSPTDGLAWKDMK